MAVPRTLIESQQGADEPSLNDAKKTMRILDTKGNLVKSPGGNDTWTPAEARERGLEEGEKVLASKSARRRARQRATEEVHDIANAVREQSTSVPPAPKGSGGARGSKGRGRGETVEQKGRGDGGGRSRSRALGSSSGASSAAAWLEQRREETDSGERPNAKAAGKARRTQPYDLMM